MSASQTSSRSAVRSPRDAQVCIKSALANVLEREARAYLRSLLAAHTGRRRAVHELRIAIRRLAAALELAQSVRPDGKWRRMERKVREPFRTCGRLRDQQVVRENLRHWRKRDQIPEQLLRQADERVKQYRARLVRCLESIHARKTCRRIQAMAVTLADSKRAAREPGASASGARAVARALTRSKREMRSAWRRARVEDPASLHRARVAVKVYRYQLEIASSLCVPASRAELPALRRSQKELGEITDLALLLSEFERFLARHPDALRGLDGVRSSLERERKRRFAAAYAAIDKNGAVRRYP